MAATRLFSKQRYSLHGEFKVKREAQAAAKEWRQAGYKVRVVEVSKGYLVYARKVAGRAEQKGKA